LATAAFTGLATVTGAFATGAGAYTGFTGAA